MEYCKPRPLEDVYNDLYTKLIKMLPGSQAVYASWSILNRSWEIIQEADSILEDDRITKEDREKMTTIERFVRDSQIFGECGKFYVASQAIHTLADVFKVETVIWHGKDGDDE